MSNIQVFVIQILNRFMHLILCMCSKWFPSITLKCNKAKYLRHIGYTLRRSYVERGGPWDVEMMGEGIDSFGRSCRNSYKICWFCARTCFKSSCCSCTSWHNYHVSSKFVVSVVNRDEFILYPPIKYPDLVPVANLHISCCVKGGDESSFWPSSPSTCCILS